MPPHTISIDTTIPVGTRVVLVEDHRHQSMAPHARAGMRGTTMYEFNDMNEALPACGGYHIQFEGGVGFLVNASAVRREVEDVAVEPAASESLPAVLVDDFRDRLILDCAARYFSDNWTSGSWADGARRAVEFADAVMAERAKVDASRSHQ